MLKPLARWNCPLAALGLLLTLTAPVGAEANAKPEPQKMAVPSYFYPGALWTKMGAAAPTVGLAVINPASGPGDKPNTDYQAQVKAMQARGLSVLCYVHTSYGKRPAAEVNAEIDRAFQFYGVNGVFLDEVSSGPADLPYYIACRKAIKAKNPKALTVLNPGNEVNEGYLNAGDVICTFESSYDAYLHKYSAPAWVTKYPASRFWHIITTTATPAEMQKAVALSKERHAGWVYVTPDVEPNPYDTLPEGAYWTSELAALRKR